MMNRDLAHWRLQPSIDGSGYLSAYTTCLTPDSPYQVRVLVAKAPNTDGPYAFSFAIHAEQDDVLGVILRPEQFPEDPTRWDNHQTRYDACRAAEAWLERNRTRMAAVAQEAIDNRWQLPQ